MQDADSSKGACYEDKTEPRLLTDNTHETPKNHLDYCFEHCKLKGYKYAGVQARTWCHCGNTKPPAWRLKPSDECNNECAGDNSQKCGGPWRLMIYNLGNTMQFIY